MNFFGHAAVVTWSVPASGVAPSVVLGAVLPDFATRCGGRISSAEDAGVTAASIFTTPPTPCFHKLPAVTALMRELDDRLAHGHTQRLHRILPHRPLLAPFPDDLRAIHHALVVFNPPPLHDDSERHSQQSIGR